MCQVFRQNTTLLLAVRKPCWVFQDVVPNRTSHASDTGFSLCLVPCGQCCSRETLTTRDRQTSVFPRMEVFVVSQWQRHSEHEPCHCYECWLLVVLATWQYWRMVKVIAGPRAPCCQSYFVHAHTDTHTELCR